jgi:hypothetical protein
MDLLDKNKDVILNFGLIAVGPLREIEKLQQKIARDCKQLRIVYQTVTAKKLKLVKIRENSVENPSFFQFKARLTGESER